MSSLVAALIALIAALTAFAQGKSFVYAASGAQLIQYDVDVAGAALTRRGFTMLPDSVQYAWPSPSRRYLYVAWSNGAGAGHHGVSAFRLNPQSGALEPIGKPVALTERPIHLTTDIPGTHLLIAYSEPSGLTVHRLEADGSVGPLVKQPARLTNGFSKKLENHIAAVSLHAMYYNFVRIHQTLKVTPAMAAGVTDRLWEIADIIRLLDDWQARQEHEKLAERTAKLLGVEASSLPRSSRRFAK